MGKPVALCLRAKATARIRQPGTSHIARSSGAAAGRVSNDEALPAVCDSHVQQSVPAVRSWMVMHAGPACPASPDSVHCSVSRPSDGDNRTTTGNTITEIKLGAACREGEGSEHAQPGFALPNLAQHVELPLAVRATSPAVAWQVGIVTEARRRHSPDARYF